MVRELLHWLTAVLRTQPAESKEGEGVSSGPCASLQPASHICAAATGPHKAPTLPYESYLLPLPRRDHSDWVIMLTGPGQASRDVHPC